MNSTGYVERKFGVIMSRFFSFEFVNLKVAVERTEMWRAVLFLLFAVFVAVVSAKQQSDNIIAAFSGNTIGSKCPCFLFNDFFKTHNRLFSVLLLLLSFPSNDYYSS